MINQLIKYVGFARRTEKAECPDAPTPSFHKPVCRHAAVREMRDGIFSLSTRLIRGFRCLDCNQFFTAEYYDRKIGRK